MPYPDLNLGDRSLTYERLRSDIEQGEIDTIIVAFTDMQGRLVGKKLSASFFLSEVVANGTEGCSYLLACDVDMNTVSGYEISSWESGYGDLVMTCDMSTLRYIPWQQNTAMVQADVVWEDGSILRQAPRSILKAQLKRLADRGLRALVGTELEFIVFENSYEEAWEEGYRNLKPANKYNVDYSLLGVSRIDGLLREIRLGMTGANMEVESVKGECNLGQHEIAFRYSDALRTADNHVVYKLGAKEIAAARKKSITFMAKFNEREGSSCHTHLSIRGLDDSLTMVDPVDPKKLSNFGSAFIAGQLAHMRETTLFMAPNINSYKRFVEGSFAPTAIAWGIDNRTCSIRLVGRGPGLRYENRLPGGDANPYLVIAAMIASGLDGVDSGMTLEEPYPKSAYDGDLPRVSDTLRSALDDFSSSAFNRASFGDDVVDHYANMAKVELDAFNRSVTDWERFRSFERM